MDASEGRRGWAEAAVVAIVHVGELASRMNWDLIKHTQAHVVRTCLKGLRLDSTNYEPHRFSAAGAVDGNYMTLSIFCLVTRSETWSS